MAELAARKQGQKSKINVIPTQVSNLIQHLVFVSNNHDRFLERFNYEPTHVLMAMRMMLVGVDTFSLTLNRRLSTEKELRRRQGY